MSNTPLFFHHICVLFAAFIIENFEIYEKVLVLQELNGDAVDAEAVHNFLGCGGLDKDDLG